MKMCFTRKRRDLKTLLLSAAAALACGPLFAAAAPAADPAGPAPADLANTLGFKVGARAPEKGNTLVSPYGLYSIFAMVYDGSRETTAAEIRTVFSFPEDRETLRRDAQQLRYGLIKAVKGSEFKRVNAVWLQKGYELAPDFETVMKSSYSASAEIADFRSSPERAAKTANAWTQKQTAGQIAGFFEPNSFTLLTRLALANAVSFKGRWKTAFSTGATSEQEFHIQDGTVAVQMMTSAAPVKINYYEDEELQAAGLDYLGGRLRMVLLLPGPEKTAGDIYKAISPERLAAIRAGLATKIVDAKVSLPRFTLAGSWDLAAHLSALGMPGLFTDAADLSGMMGRKGLYLQRAVQKVYLKVDEEGAPAPARRARGRAKKPVVFKADRPFILLIEDKRTGLILFLGRVDDPSLAGT